MPYLEEGARGKCPRHRSDGGRQDALQIDSLKTNVGRLGRQAGSGCLLSWCTHSRPKPAMFDSLQVLVCWSSSIEMPD